ncbi:MAG TPA: hypothetical protein VFV81_04005, partial [Verrucomicrobiae bacterium]|nr:hypothetical protein [Verrucomicrobiae bacterium]
MNGDDLGQKAVAAGRRLIRFSALVLLLVALASLAACAFAYFRSDFLRPDVVLTPEAADKMRKVVALAMFRV